MRRRDFLFTSVGGLVAGGAAARGVSAEDGPTEEMPPIEIIDTHTHFYDPTRPQGVPWPSKNNKRLYRPVLPAEYERLARPLGIAGTVVVEASPWVEDNQWLLELAAKHPFLVGVVGHLDMASDAFDKHLRRFAANPLYRGLRIGHTELQAGLKGMGRAPAEGRQAPEGAWSVDRGERLVERGLELDVNGGPQMPADVARLAARLPKLRIVINHGANLRIDGKEPPRAWRDGMAAAARHPNVFCKVSALVEHTTRKPAPRDVDYYRPVLDTLWTLFGEERLVFGSNWPVSGRAAPLKTVVGVVRDYFTAKGRRAAEKFFHANSQTAYAWRKR